jgi:hypothetical protein
MRFGVQHSKTPFDRFNPHSVPADAHRADGRRGLAAAVVYGRVAVSVAW